MNNLLTGKTNKKYIRVKNDFSDIINLCDGATGFDYQAQPFSELHLKRANRHTPPPHREVNALICLRSLTTNLLGSFVWSFNGVIL